MAWIVISKNVEEERRTHLQVRVVFLSPRIRKNHRRLRWIKCGGDFDHRWTQTRESVLAMKELWTKTEAEFHGKYYDFPPVRSYPKPMQKPHPPVLLGGGAKKVLERIVAWGDGWLPNRITPAELRDSRATLDRLAKDAGRDPAAISISVHGQPADRDLIGRLLDAGATRVIVRPPTVKTEAEMAVGLTRIADAVLR